MPVSFLNPATSKWLFTENTNWWRDNLLKVRVPILFFAQSLTCLCSFDECFRKRNGAYCTRLRESRKAKLLWKYFWMLCRHSCSCCHAFCAEHCSQCSCLLLSCLMGKSAMPHLLLPLFLFLMRHIIWTPVGHLFYLGRLSDGGAATLPAFNRDALTNRPRISLLDKVSFILTLHAPQRLCIEIKRAGKVNFGGCCVWVGGGWWWTAGILYLDVLCLIMPEPSACTHTQPEAGSFPNFLLKTVLHISHSNHMLWL